MSTAEIVLVTITFIATLAVGGAVWLVIHFIREDLL